MEDIFLYGKSWSIYSALWWKNITESLRILVWVIGHSLLPTMSINGVRHEYVCNHPSFYFHFKVDSTSSILLNMKHNTQISGNFTLYHLWRNWTSTVWIRRYFDNCKEKTNNWPCFSNSKKIRIIYKLIRKLDKSSGKQGSTCMSSHQHQLHYQ